MIQSWLGQTEILRTCNFRPCVSLRATAHNSWWLKWDFKRGKRDRRRLTALHFVFFSSRISGKSAAYPEAFIFIGRKKRGRYSSKSSADVWTRKVGLSLIRSFRSKDIFNRMMREKEKIKREQKEEEGNILDFINLNYQLNFMWEKKAQNLPQLTKTRKVVKKWSIFIRRHCYNQ